jgi:hypothetical protein
MNIDYELPESAPVEFNIDKSKGWACIVDDIDAVQSDIDLFDTFTNDATNQLKIAIEYQVYSNIYNQANSSNRGKTAGAVSAGFNLGVSTTPVQITKTNVLEYIADAETVLDEQNVLPEDRWMVIPAWMANMLSKSDLKDSSFIGEKSIIRTGRLGQIYGFTLYKSNNLYYVTDTVSCWYVPFGHKKAITFASQMAKTSSFEAERTYGHIVRGQNLYGFKVVVPKALGELYVRR